MNKHVGGSFDDFLEEENLFSKTSAEALKRVIAWQIKNYLDVHHITKSTFAKKIQTSRSQLDRLLDPENTNISLKTLVSTAKVMGKNIKISMTD